MTFLNYCKIYFDWAVFLIWSKIKKHMLYTIRAVAQLSNPPDNGKKKPRAFDFLNTSHIYAEGS